MIAEATGPTCHETFREEAAEAVPRRAAAHDHRHRDVLESLAPELEAQMRAFSREVPA